MQHPADEDPAEPAVAVGEGVDRLELGVDQRGGCDRVVAFVVREGDQVAHQRVDAVVGHRDVRGALRRGSADPAEAVAPRSLLADLEVGRCRQDPVPRPQVVDGQRAFVREGGVDGAQVVGDPCGRAAHGSVDVGDGDELRRCVDRLDPARRQPFGAEQQSGGHLEARIVSHRQRGQDPFGAGGVASGLLAERSHPEEGSGDERGHRATLPVDGDQLVRHRTFPNPAV